MTLGRLCRNPKGDELMTFAQETLSQSYPSGGSRQQAASLRPRHLAARGSHPRGNVCPWPHGEQQRQGLTPCRKVKGAGLPSSVITDGHDGGHCPLWGWSAKANRMNVKISCKKDPTESSKP